MDVEIIVPLAFFATVVLLIWISSLSSRARLQTKAGFHEKLLAKFSSGSEFSEFLAQEGSRRFVEELWSSHTDSRSQILGQLRNGVILTVLGLGLGALMPKENDMMYPAVIVLALGVGFLAAAGVNYHFSKKWGLLKTDDGSRPSASRER